MIRNNKKYLKQYYINRKKANPDWLVTMSIKAKLSGWPLYKWIIDNGFPKYFQTLCMNCNHGKRMNNGVCPHLTLYNE